MTLSQPLDIKMNRKGFGMRAEVREEVETAYQSDIIEEIKKAGYTKTFGRVTIHLAQEFGFCYGVDRAVELAYETRKNFPDKRIFLTTEIIHNPSVNHNLQNMGIGFLAGPYKSAHFDDITPDDVVIVPAFGTTIHELSALADKKCTLVDTICGSVINVWKRVEKYAQDGFTAVIHGKYYHEETMATSSRMLQFPHSHYIIVFNEEEAQIVIDYMLGAGNPRLSKEDFYKMFAKSCSAGFDPDVHLAKVGLANQTTMLSSDSLKIAKMFEQAMNTKYGAANLDQHYRAFDTICSATQERQDAIIALQDKKPDLILVIGGYNSSNTTHLNEIASRFAKSYHIDKPDCIIDKQQIRCKPLGQKEEILQTDWLPEGPISLGITAGASTPNKVMGDVLERVLRFSS